MHIIEILIIVVVMFVVVFQFINIPPVNTEWSETKLLMMGNDMLYALDRIGVDWTDADGISALLDDAITHGGTRNTTIMYDLKLAGVVKPHISVGCICNDALGECDQVEDALQPFYLNGRNISFTVERVDPDDAVFSHEHDVMVIMPDFFRPTYHDAHTLDEYITEINNFLGAGKGIIIVRSYTAAAAAPGTLDQDYFGISWDDSLSQTGELSLSFNETVTYPDSPYYDVYKYFSNFPNSSGLKMYYPYTFTNLLYASDRTVPNATSSAECVLEDEDGDGVCGLIANRGVVSGSGRTAWLSKFEGPDGADDSNNVLLRSLVAWVAGDIHHVIRNEDMEKPAVARLYRMYDRMSGHSGMLARWEMNEGSGPVAYDSSGNANHGTVNGPVPAEGRSGSALAFDGIDDYVDLGRPESLQVRNSVTIAAWIKPNKTYDNTAVDDQEIYRASLADWLALRLDSTAGHEGEARFGSSVIGSVYSTTSAWNKDVWYHLAGTYDGSECKIYVNGDIENTAPCSVEIADFTEDIYIGARPPAADHAFNGTIDQVIVYDRALAPEDIKGLYDFPEQFMFQPVEIILTLGYIY